MAGNRCVRGAENGVSGTHPFQGDELRARGRFPESGWTTAGSF